MRSLLAYRAPSTIVALTAAALSFLAAPAGAANLEPDLLAGLAARSIGPAGMSGRVAAIEAVVADPEIVYVGAATGGVWKSTNGGLSFTPIFDDQLVHSIGALAIYQPNPAIVWAGTGEGNPRNSVSVGQGIYRSLDGGATWQLLGLEKTERIHRILLHPADPDLAYVCAMGRAWGENPDRGVFKTTDGGKTWTKILYLDEKTGCGELAIDPANPQKLLAGLWQFRRWPWFMESGGPGSGLYATHDGGATWKRLQEEDGLPKGELGRMGIAFSHSNPEIVYALVEAEKNALLRSEDGGRSWKTVNDETDVAPRPFYFNDVRVDPAWPNRVYTISQLIRVSDDGGKTSRTLPGAGWSDLHGDYHAMWIHPGNPNLIYVGNDGGVAVSQDRGKSFRFVSNLPLAQFYHVAYDMETPYNLYGGLQDNGSWRGPSSAWAAGGLRNHQWKTVGGGDGFDVQPDPEDPTRGYSMSQGGYLVRWNLKTGEERIIRPAPPEGIELRFNWNTGLALDPFAPATVYYGSQFLHRSRDRGETWETISPDLTSNNPEWQKQRESGGLTLDVTAAENHCTILAIAPSPKQQGVIWVGTDDGRLQVTRDAGATWASVEKNLPRVPANTWIPHVEASQFDPAEAFVVLDNHRRSDWAPYVYRTRDFGKTWTSLATSDLRGYALSIEQDPVERDLLFLGTEFGLFLSLDAGASWLPFRHGLPTASVMDLAVHPRDHDLIIATHGRALYVLDDLTPLRKLTAEALREPLHLFPTAPARQYWRTPDEGGFGFGAGEFRGQNRAYGALLTYSLSAPGLPLADEKKERARKERERQAARAEPEKEGEEKAADKPPEKPGVKIEITDAAGAVVRTLEGPAKLGINRMAWDFSRDAFKLPPSDEPRPWEPSGPQVPPGTYGVTVKHGEQVAKGSVTVLADPRSTNTPADWERRWQATLRQGELNDRAIAALTRIQRTRKDIDLVSGKVRQAAEDQGEKDRKKIDEDPLLKAGEKVKEGLTELEKRLWILPDTKGIPAEEGLVLSHISQVGWFLGSSWDAPSPTQLAYLDMAAKRLETFQKDLDAFFATEVAAYKKQVEEAKVGLLGGV